MKRIFLLLLLVSFLGFFQSKAVPLSPEKLPSEVQTPATRLEPMVEKVAKMQALKGSTIMNARSGASEGVPRKIQCLVLSTTGHFELMHPLSIRQIMETYGGVEYTYLFKNLNVLTPEKLLEYDVVWIYNFTSWDREGTNITNTQMSNLLGAYIKGGGYLLECMHVQNMNPIAKFGLLDGTYATEGMSPFKPANRMVSGYANMGEVTNPKHPIMDSVRSVSIVDDAYYTDAKEDAFVLAYYEETGSPLISVYDNIVGINMSPVGVNPISGVGSFLYGDAHRIFHNSIKWLYSNKYDVTAPDGIRNLTADPFPVNAQFNISLKWTNPSYCINGAPLNNLSSIKIYRDDVLIKTLDNPVKGEMLSWTDENVPQGKHIYKVIPCNLEQAGYISYVNTFSGSDIPSSVQAVNLYPKGNDGYLTWSNLVYGANNGWVDTASLKYKIVRKPDNVTLATEHRGNVFTDNSIPVKNRYYYEITPFTKGGQGLMAKSETMYLRTGGDIYMGTAKVTTCSGKFYGPEGPGSNYQNNRVYALTIAPENPESGQRTQVDFTQFDINSSVGGLDDLFVLDGPDLNAEQIEGSPFAGKQVPEILKNLRASAGNESGALTFAFMTSSEGVGTGWEAAISCVQLSDIDLAAISVKGENLPNVNKAYTYKAIIKNEGLQAQNNFKVRFFVGTPSNFLDSVWVDKNLASGDTMHFSFVWTPQSVGVIPIGVLVEIAGDENMQNNQTKPYIVTVQTETTVTAKIKNTFDLSTMFVPFCFFHTQSVTQSLYNPKEINLAKGKLLAIRYSTNFSLAVPNERVILHLAETTKKDLSSGWTPLSKMKKVYEGIISFPQGKNEITIVLDSTFDYKGGSLIVRAEHPTSKYKYTTAEAFDVVYDLESSYRSLMNYDETFDDNKPIFKAQSFYPCAEFTMDVKGAAAIKGVVTSKGDVLDSVVVSIKGTYFIAKTDKKGEYIFPSVNPDTCILEFSKYGYVTQIVSGVISKDGNTVIKNVELDEIPKAIISGKITDDEGLPISGAQIQLSGYENYESNSIADGTFSIERVYTDKKYEIKVTKDRFAAYTADFNFGENDTTLNITLTQIPYPVFYLKAANKDKSSAEIVWQNPDDMNFKRIVYDNGIASSAYVPAPEKEGWFGSSFAMADSGILESIDLFGARHYGLDSGELGVREVRVDIFDGRKKLLTSSKGFYMPSEAWINIPLDYFPYKGTFYAMVYFPEVQANQYSNLLGADTKGPNANNQTNYYTDGVAWAILQSIAQVSPCVFLLRANVFIHGESVQLQASSAPLPSEEYIEAMSFTPEQRKNIAENVFEIVDRENLQTAAAPPMYSKPDTKTYEAKFFVYRFLENQKDSIAKWTLLTPTPISDPPYVDAAYGSLSQGSYHYAVRSVYSEDLISQAAISNALHKDMSTTINLVVGTNTTAGTAKETEVRLSNTDQNKEHIYSGVLDAEGKLSIPNVWKGSYSVRLVKIGFEILDTTVMFNTENDYTLHLVLQQEKKQPYNLKMDKVDGQEGSYTFSWNESKNYEEGFESHADFQINSPGKMNWSYKDRDRVKTFAISGYTFPEQNSEMAYIIFNPSQTQPPMTDVSALPYKGKKYLAGFSSSLAPNDDWIISPELNYSNEFVFSFYAKTLTSQKGMEKIRVGYSNTGKAPEDFTWIQGGYYISIPAEWEQYTYTIPGSAKYVTIQYVSDNMFMLMIDEIFIGNEKQGESQVKEYKVYLDGVEVAKTQNKNYTFTNITNPENRKAGVLAVYETGESEISEIGFITAGMEDDAFAKTLQVYPNPAKDVIFLDGLKQSATYEIYNMYGSMLKTHKTSNSVEQIFISDLSSGSYVIRIISTQGTAVKRFIKQ